jgi:hypothetical protein
MDLPLSSDKKEDSLAHQFQQNKCLLFFSMNTNEDLSFNMQWVIFKGFKVY